ncbi:GNAT family acetyltransferase [Hydrogenophaga taeniospiralis CCUG 15921]|uniref:GNAT family acetyltransferase n=1 Tax=Hydrogenophaga taeniospiralis CCUG 15921 TaxID=1281780 RepID=A0A9X4NR84_9BURK|nr:GNAT family N-acetyltransferase [Hydrogenophaga taeniospiralis]MDG5974451.1 GNAT family acetyltransferase [Hydrogenophaga taeniospiralis CCUG 15921]
MTTTPLQLTRWQALTSEQQQSVLALHISQEQIEFAGTMAQAVAVGEGASPDDVAGLAVLQAGAPVGFVVLCRGSRLPEWAPAGAVALRAMRIDSREQGKGHGRRALALVEAWLAEHWPTCSLLALCVDDHNLAARRAYEAAGFTEYMEPKLGRIGLVRYLAKPLAVAARHSSNVRAG